MSAEEQIREEVGTLFSNTGAKPMSISYPLGGDVDPESAIAAIQLDIRQLYQGLLLVGRQIDHLSRKLDSR